MTNSAMSTDAEARRSDQTSHAYGAWTFIVVALVAVLYCLTAARVESYGSDTSTYFGLAESLRNHHAYWFDFEPHVTYPPGYPLLLAGLMSIAGDRFATLVRLSIPFYFVGLLGVYWLIKLQRGAPTAAALTILAAVSGDAYFWSTVGLHSDVPYFTVSIYVLLCVVAGEHTPSRRRRLLCQCAGAILLAYLVLLRSVGVTLVAGLALWTCYPLLRAGGERASVSWTRIRRWAPAVLLPILVLLVWSSWTRRHASPSPGDYMDSYGQQILKQDPHQIDSPRLSAADLPARVLRMGATRTINALRMVLNTPPIYLSWYNPIVIGFTTLVIIGLGMAIVRHPSVLEAYMVTYGGLLLLYPFDEGTRYLLPILPFLALYAADGIRTCYAWTKRALGSARAWRRLAFGGDSLLAATLALVYVAAALGGVVRIVTLAGVNLHPDPTQFTNIATMRVSDWLMQHSQATDVIMDDQWAILHRLTSRKTVRFPLTTDPATIAARIASDSVRYVVVLNEKPFEYYNPSTMRRFDRVRELHPDWFTSTHVFQDGTIYRVRRGEFPAAASAAQAHVVLDTASAHSLHAPLGATAGEKQ